MEGSATPPSRELQIASHAVRCAFCHTGVEIGDRAICATCLAMHHLECWREHGSCATCATRRVLTLEAEVAKVGKTVQDWVEALADEHDKLRRRLAARALMELGGRAHLAVSPLTKALQDPDTWVQRWSCAALGAIGARAGLAIPALVQAGDKATVDKVRRAANAAILAIETAKGRKQTA